VSEVLIRARHLIALLNSIIFTTVWFIYMPFHFICWRSISLSQLSTCLKWNRLINLVNLIPCRHGWSRNVWISSYPSWQISQILQWKEVMFPGTSSVLVLGLSWRSQVWILIPLSIIEQCLTSRYSKLLEKVVNARLERYLMINFLDECS